MTDLAGKVVFITGASSGIGRYMAAMLAAEGAIVAAAARRIEALNDLASGASSAPGRILPVALDVTDVPAIEPALDEIERRLGPIEILVNNAGVGHTSKAIQVPEADYDRVFNTNVKGAFFMARSVGARMIDRGNGGRIVNVASVAGLVTMPYLTVYCMSKAAIVHMTRNLAREWARYNINVNALCPGYIATEFNTDYFASDAGKRMAASLPRGRVGEPEDLADALKLLLGGTGSRMLNGAILTVDDGYAVS